MKIVVLDGYTENPGDLSWAPLEKYGELTVYDRTSYVDSPLIAERIGDAEIVIINKTPITKETIDKCPNIKLIAVLATGYNVVDYNYAKEKDIPRILELLKQVLQIHADIRPDIFIPGTTKYTIDELREILKNKETPIYVAVNEADVCVGYAFCQLREQPFSNNMVPFKSLFIDDLCIDQEARGQHIGESLFEYVKNEAKQLGCYEVTLNVWTGNTSAEKFYERMGMRTKKRQMEYTDL